MFALALLGSDKRLAESVGRHVQVSQSAAADHLGDLVGIPTLQRDLASGHRPLAPGAAPLPRQGLDKSLRASCYIPRPS